MILLTKELAKMIMSLVLIAFISPILTHCRSSVTPIGSKTYQPLPDTANVLVFSNESDVHNPFVVVGIVSYTNPGKYQVLTLSSAMPKLKARARSVGANGIIIDQIIPIRSGLISTGISVRGRAIRINMEE